MLQFGVLAYRSRSLPAEPYASCDGHVDYSEITLTCRVIARYFLPDSRTARTLALLTGLPNMHIFYAGPQDLGQRRLKVHISTLHSFR